MWMSLKCLPNRQKNFPGPICLPCLLVSSLPSSLGRARALPDRKLASGPSHTGKPLPDPTQTDTYPPNQHYHHPTPCVFSPQISSASPALIGLTVVHSPHLLVEIGWRLFPFLDGQGQGTMGYRVRISHPTCSTATVVDYESQLCVPPPPPLSPSLLERKHSGQNYTLQYVASRLPGIKVQTSHQTGPSFI